FTEGNLMKQLLIGLAVTTLVMTATMTEARAERGRRGHTHVTYYAPATYVVPTYVAPVYAAPVVSVAPVAAVPTVTPTYVVPTYIAPVATTSYTVYHTGRRGR